MATTSAYLLHRHTRTRAHLLVASYTYIDQQHWLLARSPRELKLGDLPSSERGDGDCGEKLNSMPATTGLTCGDAGGAADNLPATSPAAAPMLAACWSDSLLTA
jgi:hypothetical protein